MDWNTSLFFYHSRLLVRGENSRYKKIENSMTFWQYAFLVAFIVYLLATSVFAILLNIEEIRKLLRRRKNSKSKMVGQQDARLAVQFEQLLEAHKNLNAKFNALVGEYSRLKADYSSLAQIHQALIEHYKSLERAYNNLENLYNQLLISHDNLEREINRLRHQLQIAVAIIIGFVGVVIYLLGS